MFHSILGSSLTVFSFLICIVMAMVLGFIVAFFHKLTVKSNHTFTQSLVILPVLVTMVILLVNGNLGTSVAIAGAFTLVRFRSIPGNSREIVSVFFTMVIGVALGMGYIGFASIFTVAICLLSYLLNRFHFGESSLKERFLKVSIPEDLDYEEVFDDLFLEYCKEVSLRQTKTVNMGSMFELTYFIVLKDDIKEKEFIDNIRIKNGNLKVSLTHELEEKGVL